MSNIPAKAKEYLSYQLSVIPTKEDKTPALPSWKPYQTTRLKEEEVAGLFTGANVRGIAIICGAISGGLEVIDVDTKHDTTGTLWDEFRTLIEDNLPELYSSLVIAQTKSGGYHIYYRGSQVDRNLKLSTKLNKEVLIETRGEGGYVIAPPTPAYKYIQGEPGNIPTITPLQRETLLGLAKSFNQLPEEKPIAHTPPAQAYNSTGLSPFEDYNNRGDVVGLLQRQGWRVISEAGERVSMLRPGETDSKSSGDFHTGKRLFKVFTTSTIFEAEKGYSPSSVFSLLECNGDNKQAYRRLLELGYGEPFTGENKAPTQIKTERIKVEGVNKGTRETSAISTPGDSLRIEDVETAIGDEVVISSPGSEATEEVLKAIALIEETGKRVYITEGGSEVRAYKYRLRAIFNKYGAIQEESGGLTDRAIDSLLDEVIETSQKLQPIDKAIFLKDFLSYEAIKELGITEESLSITVDRLTTTRDKETQAQGLKGLLSEAIQLQEKGETVKALELLGTKAKEVKLQDKATEFSSLLIPVKEEDIRDRQAKKPESLRSGYTIDKEELLLPSGALSIFTAPTSHGKTTLLINLALNIVKEYPQGEAYFFSYEEDGDSILMNTLNTYQGEELSTNNRRTLKSYFTTGSTEFIKGDKRAPFIASKEAFFSELIATRRLNISYSPYDSDTLIEAIRYLRKNTKVSSIFIDYMQLLHKPRGLKGKAEYSSRQEELKQICLDLKDIAVETGLPIILGAQFNREVVSQLLLHSTKIGEAGDIERIANVVVGFWNNNFKPIAKGGEVSEIAEIGGNTPDTLYTVILKNRGGRVGLTELLEWNGNTGVIKNKANSYF